MKYLVILTVISVSGCMVSPTTHMDIPEKELLVNTENTSHYCRDSKRKGSFDETPDGLPVHMLFHEQCLNAKNLLIITVPAHLDKSEPERLFIQRDIFLLAGKYAKSLRNDIEWDYRLVNKEHLVDDGHEPLEVFFFVLTEGAPMGFPAVPGATKIRWHRVSVAL